MMETRHAYQTYQDRLAALNLQLAAQLRRSKQLGLVRLIVFLVMITLAYFGFTRYGWYGSIALAAGLAILLFLVSKDADNKKALTHTRKLIGINEDELRILQHDFHSRFDGAAFEPTVHHYAHDMDLFGPASLFQWMNRAYTEQGQQKLAAGLLDALPPDTILARQEAASEIAPAIEWRQQCQATAMLTPVTILMEKKIMDWTGQSGQPYHSSGWKWFVGIYTAITFGTAALTILGYIDSAIFGFLYVVYFGLSIFLSRSAIRPYLLLSGITAQISTLGNLVKHFDAANWKSALLHELLQATQTERSGHREIKALENILDRFDQRLNLVGMALLNPFLLWDIRQMRALNNWRLRNQQTIPSWFAMIAEMEVIHSLATVRFNNPQWCTPEIVPDYCHLKTTKLGHPLIAPAKRVDNDFDIHGQGTVALITGSNMAGKSTFLRSIGVNLILAQMGSVTCAKTFSFSPMRLMSSMRIADNLADNTSTFYAELKKLEGIIASVNRHEKILVLLDEILRGTNSLDRHKGSAAVIRQLLVKRSAGIIATHDLELAVMEKEFPDGFANYHVDVSVSGEELYFDYVLKNGVCTSLNASILMKKIGLELT